MDCVTDLKLTATPLHAQLGCAYDADPIVVRMATSAREESGPNRALLVRSIDGAVPAGFAAYFCARQVDRTAFAKCGRQALVYALPDALAFLEDGDVVRINPRTADLWVMYRRRSPSNSLLLTERCNSWCIMCSQPPRPAEDGWLVRAWLDAIPLISRDSRELGFTGGEPTLLGDRFLQLVALCKLHLPTTALHVLSNGRLFNYLSFAERLSAVEHPNLVVGIPIYSDIPWQHDFIVQAKHAFDQTVRGILNLARCTIRIEVRVVVHQHSIERLPKLAEFIARNLPFVEHVALMALEPIGFANSNLPALWVDPVDCHVPLAAAVRTLVTHGMNVSIYNHQLCVLPKALWPFARQSISDWKNVYLPVCQECAVRKDCAGFFHSAIETHSRSITPVGAEATAAASPT